MPPAFLFLDFKRFFTDCEKDLLFLENGSNMFYDDVYKMTGFFKEIKM